MQTFNIDLDQHKRAHSYRQRVESISRLKAAKQGDGPGVVTCQFLHLLHALLHVQWQERRLANDVDSDSVPIE